MIPGLGRFPGERKGYLLQYSGLENSMECIDHGVARSRTQLSDFHFRLVIAFPPRSECLLFLHFFFNKRKKVNESHTIVSNSLGPHGLNSSCNSPGQNTGVDSLSLLQGIFSTQGLNPGLPHCGWILYQLSHKGSPKILEWLAYPFSSRSS